MIRVSLLSVAAVLAFAAGTAPSAFAKDGVYTSTTLGRNGDVTVQTTITNGRIADVKVLDWSETHPILKTVESTLSQIRRRRARGTSGLWPSSP